LVLKKLTVLLEIESDARKSASDSCIGH